jgi:hypothetical protein
MRVKNLPYPKYWVSNNPSHPTQLMTIAIHKHLETHLSTLLKWSLGWLLLETTFEVFYNPHILYEKGTYNEWDWQNQGNVCFSIPFFSKDDKAATTIFSLTEMRQSFFM